MKAKRRYCRQHCLPKSQFCGNHQSHETNQETSTVRVPCPLDPSHDVATDKLQQHLKKCPSLQKQKKLEEASYYCRDINRGGDGPLTLKASDACIENTDRKDLAWAQRVAIVTLQIHQKLFTGKALSEKEVWGLTQREIEAALVLNDYSKHEMDSGLAGAVEAHRIKSGGPKHLHQQASLLGHLRQLGASPRPEELDINDLRDTNKKPRTTPRTFFEMGAGRGMLGCLSAGVSAATWPTSLVLVERSGSRSKADTVLRNIPQEAFREGVSRYMRLNDLQWSRIQCDLAHVEMTTVVKEQNVSDMHVIAKHLCGAGTDLALKALEPVKEHLSTCLFATCCHGLCNWDDYVGRGHLQEMFSSHEIEFFDKEEFELLRRWSAATVLPSDEHSASSNIDEHGARAPSAVGRVVESLGLTCGVQGLGRCCQRLIDQGRCDYMRTVLFPATDQGTTRLEYYVPPTVTPQNCIIRGKRNMSTQRLSGLP